MSDHEIDAIARTARRKHRLPPGAACATCATNGQLSCRPDGRVLCYADLQKERGLAAVELDHVAGRRNLGGLLVKLHANDHRTVTEWRLLLGIEDWPDANGDPLLLAAHIVAGIATILLLVAAWLVELATDAVTRLGPAGWEGAPLAPLVP
jgi:hypothetical protein